MLDVKALGDLSAALLTPVIGVVTTIILINQHRLEKRKLRLQLFEKRYAVYLAAMEYITTIMREGKSTTAAQAAFLRDSRDRVFLFDKRIHQFLEEVWKQSIELETHQEICHDLLVGSDCTKHVEAAAAIKKQLPVLAKRAQELFGDYLKMVERSSLTHAMEPTASRRTIQPYMRSACQLAAMHALARGSSSCSR